MADFGKENPEQLKGWLLKWTNYIKGYQRRWFVLSNGLLSYYRTQEEMAHTCRGTVNLAGAFIDPIDLTQFIVTNGPSQVYHLRALNEVEKQRWVTALELAKAKAIKNLESESDSGPDSEDEKRGGGSNENPLMALQDKLAELGTAHDIVVKSGRGLAKSIGELEESGGRGVGGKLSEQLALFKLTALGMLKAADEFVVQGRNTERRWSRALQHEHSIRVQLQENTEALAKQMTRMEDEARQQFQGATAQNGPHTTNSTSKPLPNSKTGSLKREGKQNAKKHVTVSGERQVLEMIDSPDDDDDQFFDAPEISDEDWVKAASSATPTPSTPRGHKRNISTTSVNEAHDLVANSPGEGVDKPPVSSDRRMSIPEAPTSNFLLDVQPTLPQRRTAVPPKPSYRLNYWSIMKNCIGKDLSKIPMPVNFNEPLSMLQRMGEEMKYADILHRAANAQDTLEEMAYVGAFANSPYAATAGLRANKPFNPMLGETYECDRRAEMGWRCIFEQVSHHPPMFSEYCEGKDWTFWQEYTVSSKFRGKYLTVYPIGACHLVFHKTKSHYTWCKAVTTVHNIIVGKLWIDQSGEIKITNHTTREEGLLKFHAYSYFSREQQRKISGHVQDVDGNVRYVLKGYWDQQFDMAKVIGGEGKNLETEPCQTLWRVQEPEPGNEVMYGFAHFTSSLNELEPGIAPTDCRFRPDQRIMEEGDFPRADKEKLRLEEKQRAKRRKREALAAQAAKASARGDVEEAERLKEEATYKPVWFSKEYDPLTNTMMHVYKGGYWEAKQTGDWDKFNLPDLY
ncbi:oxysterol-binding protein 1-like isoform X2 [Halichondria panicea]|uniref:oxysterol-binding protein 1-like isoform X2 n=1 Tax=Halichondria panicea TaxID=6063 RepID=UPI00312B781D